MDKVTFYNPAGFAPKSKGGIRYFQRGTKATIYAAADSDDISFHVSYADGSDTWISAHAYSSYVYIDEEFGESWLMYLFRITVTVKGPMTINVAW